MASSDSIPDLIDGDALPNRMDGEVVNRVVTFESDEVDSVADEPFFPQPGSRFRSPAQVIEEPDEPPPLLDRRFRADDDSSSSSSNSGPGLQPRALHYSSDSESEPPPLLERDAGWDNYSSSSSEDEVEDQPRIEIQIGRAHV